MLERGAGGRRRRLRDQCQHRIKHHHPAAVAPASTFSGLVEKQSISLGYNVSQIEYSAAYNLAFVRTGTSSIHVIDGRTGTDLGVQNATSQFTDFSVSPDGRYLYVADYGGTNDGYGTPSGTSYVDRYDAVTQTWTSKPVVGIAYQSRRSMMTDSYSRALISGPRSRSTRLARPRRRVPRSLRRSTATMKETFSTTRPRAVYLGNSGSSSNEIHVYQVVGNSR